MNSILTKFHLSPFLYVFFLCAFLCGYFKPMLLLFAVVLWHELGHILCFKYYKYPLLKVELFPFGGITTVEKPINTPIHEEFLIACGGFFMQGLLFLFLPKLPITENTLQLLTTYNTSLFLFNLLPIYPLDGSKLLECIFETKYPYTTSLKKTNLCCSIAFSIFCLLNLYSPQKNIMMCLFLGIECFLMIQKQRYIKKRFLLERLLHQYPYSKIESHDTVDLNYLKKDTLHFFKQKNHYVHEKNVLKAYFDS